MRPIEAGCKINLEGLELNTLKKKQTGRQKITDDGSQ